MNVPAGTKIRLEFANINNPIQVSANYKVTVTTRNAANTPIDGPTPSTAYTMKQIGANVIADNSITSTKPAESFMKKVNVLDNAAGNAVGWNPNNVVTNFNILEDGVIGGGDDSFVSVIVASGTNLQCQTNIVFPDGFQFTCDTAPSDGARLEYMVVNLPPNLVT